MGKKQKNLEGQDAPAPSLKAFLSCKHNSLDSVTGERKITLYGNLRGDDSIGGFNINLNGITEQKYDELLRVLDVPDLTRDTPIFLSIVRPEGSIMDDWVKEQTAPEAGEEE